MILVVGERAQFDNNDFLWKWLERKIDDGQRGNIDKKGSFLWNEHVRAFEINENRKIDFGDFQNFQFF